MLMVVAQSFLPVKNLKKPRKRGLFNKKICLIIQLGGKKCHKVVKSGRKVVRICGNSI